MDRETLAVEAARAGATLAGDLYRTSLDVETKGSAIDYVTEADLRTQNRIVDLIEAEFPDDTIVGEEGDQRKRLPDDGTAWVIDPIDGTTNYISGIPFWATSVAVVEAGETVGAANVLPSLDEDYRLKDGDAMHDGDPATVSDTEELETSMVAPILRYGHDHRDAYGRLLDALSPVIGDFRRLGSAQGSLSLVARGALDAAAGLVEANPWDTVAGVALIRRAGGTVTDLTGEAWTPTSRGLVASNGHLHDDLLSALPDS